MARDTPQSPKTTVQPSKEGVAAERSCTLPPLLHPASLSVRTSDVQLFGYPFHYVSWGRLLRNLRHYCP